MELTELNPSTIRFTHSSISRSFCDGNRLWDTVELLRKGILLPSDIPPIRVIFHKNSFWSVDNRRLFAFQESQISKINALRIEHKDKKFWRKMTTTEDGKTILLDGILPEQCPQSIHFIRSKEENKKKVKKLVRLEVSVMNSDPSSSEEEVSTEE